MDRTCCMRQTWNGGERRAGRNSARALCRQNQEGRYGLIPRTNNGLERSSYLNKIFGADLGSPLPGKGAKKGYMYYLQYLH